ncbi:MAG: UDP-N-acetylglucosamine 4,6-dehydratase (inverting) [Candidatus Taylorbacteria bacterium]|nr:UDP-N-acetylglucosamine 4,6-dehydratase (inverting) [Candidatus Taylorbacteria bacterium]
MNLDLLKNKTILVTGGTGSFGRYFIRKLLDDSMVKRVVVFSRDELKQSIMQSEFKDERLRFFLGDVRDLQRLEMAFRGVDIVVHAAALKQVPLLEYNPFEAVKTNIFGTQNVIEAAISNKVEKVVLVSTDKAAHPANLYGSTKLCAEKLCIAGNAYSPDGTKFSCVRYGNVLGSRGSIVDIILRDRNTKEIMVTDEKMTRFWIGLKDTFDIVIFALTHMEGGEIFVPKAPSMKLTDLFDVLVPKAKKKIVGIRPGEKIHEVLLTQDEARYTFDFDKYYVILPAHTEIHSGKKYKKFKANGKQVHPEFIFSSATNELILSKKNLLEVVKDFENMYKK